MLMNVMNVMTEKTAGEQEEMMMEKKEEGRFCVMRGEKVGEKILVYL